ncbi:MAG: CHRD domain-containing protein [Planctomycetes bacterium]|nr:CHRD domain-containing protein [Planctomycetota bacterium]
MITSRMTAKLLGACLATALPLALALPASAQTMTSTVGMDVAQEAPPPVGGSGTATATVVVDATTRAVTVSGTYTGLSSNQTAAHIHSAPFGVPGGVVVGLTGTGGTSGTFSGSGTFTVSQFNSFKNGGLYLNIHTATNGGGEIRGQIVNISCATQNGTDPQLADTAGNLIRGPKINDAVERFNVSLDCSNAGANGVYSILVHVGTLTPPSASVYGLLWYSGPKLSSVAGAHAQNVVNYVPGAGIILPNSAGLVGVPYNVQGYCSDPSAPPGRLSSALIQVIE